MTGEERTYPLPDEPDDRFTAEPPAVGLHSVPSPTPPGDAGDEPGDRLAELLAKGAGWVTVHKETGLTEHHAKKAIREHRNGASG